ncbi:MAG: Tripartite tricarboxylate transporter substrate binding protein [Deltaproteobacteria bacterium]|nr:Tripartite tricarboxylate transporter substrate binding protein [Deltaproteobacteria bacterium]
MLRWNSRTATRDRRFYRLAVSLLLVLLSIRSACAQANFYEDKTIRLVIGFSAGGISDLWGRALSRAMSQHIPGKPQILLHNMPGAGSLTAANYLYSVAKPDGLTLGFFTPGLFFNQLIGSKEVQFDWAKFVWIGSPEQTQRIIYIRGDSPFKTIDDLRGVAEGPRCGATALGTVGHYFPRLVEDALGVKFNLVLGYPGAAEIDLAIQKNEVQCRAGSLEGYFGSEPSKSWAKSGFARVLINGGAKRDARIADVATLYELMDKRKAADVTRRLATVLLSPDSIGRPLATTPGVPAERVKLLRDAFNKALVDPELVAEAKKRAWEIEPVTGEELEAIGRKVMTQPADVIERMKKILGN